MRHVPVNFQYVRGRGNQRKENVSGKKRLSYMLMIWYHGGKCEKESDEKMILLKYAKFGD